jgi:tetratricopeptide (TPR) repeat protein
MKEVGAGTEHLNVALPRLWRSRPYVPFVGVVHEHLDRRILDELGETRKEFTTDIVFLHDGYSEGRNEQKSKRYIELLREELKVRPGQAYYEAKLACTLAMLKSPESIDALWRIGDLMLATNENAEPELAYAAVLGPMFSSIQDKDLKTARTDKLIRLARGWYPTIPVAQWHVAEIEVRRGNLAAAMHSLLEVEKMAEAGDYDRRTPFQPGILGMALWTNLGIVSHQLGRKDIARRSYERILRVDPSNNLAKQNLALL